VVGPIVLIISYALRFGFFLSSILCCFCVIIKIIKKIKNNNNNKDKIKRRKTSEPAF